MSIRAGRLNRLVTLQQKATGSPAQFATGELDEVWVDVAQVWASVEPLVGREFYEAQQIQSSVTAKIRIRWRPGVDAGMRIVHQGKIYNLAHPADVRAANRELLFYCTEGDNLG